MAHTWQMSHYSSWCQAPNVSAGPAEPDVHVMGVREDEVRAKHQD